MRKRLYKLLEIPAIYDAVQRLLGSKRISATLKQAVSKKLQNLTYKNVLDVGCGTAILAEWIPGNYFGLDINSQYIKKAQKVKEGMFLVGDATNLPFENESFDLVCTLGVFHHLDAKNCRKMVSEMMRVCTTQGHVVIIDGLVPSNRLNLIGYALAKLDRGPYKIRIEAFKRMISEALPSDAMVSHAVYPIFPGEYVLSVITK